MIRFYRNITAVAALLGSAALLFSCSRQTAVVEEENNQNMMTQQSENLTVIQTKEGNLSFRFSAPLLEEYEYAEEPYIEFRKGIEIETYNDSTQTVEAKLSANYAIFMKRQQLWEAKGNVRGSNADGNQLETEQLFWNQKSKRVYSNVDSKITQKGDVIYADGFESNERFDDFVMRKVKGKVTVDTTPKQDSSAGPRGSAATARKTRLSGYPRRRSGGPPARRRDEGERINQEKSSSRSALIFRPESPLQKTDQPRRIR